ncbi:hypothetical protein RHMOL_Rhmol03G0295000 [Rhododendron molle]|uniref:Uncharacterized protein n=1 Tax=Rhododendron molle TaxID=49168 RepID=A0ACC0PM43_RHOML|nr:hypothetical protein RHMOL_Rhmol03G0295000 [Rhododendron molle]
MLVHGLFTNPFPSQTNTSPSASSPFVVLYLVFLFTLPLLSTIDFSTVASLKRHFVIYFWISLIIYTHLRYCISMVLVLVASSIQYP